MPTSTKLSVNNQRGIVAQALILVILLVGLAVGFYLVKTQTNLLPKAYDPVSGPITPPTGYQRVFVTGNTYWNTNFGGLNGADNICKTEANNAGLGGNWVAWLSTSTVNAKDRIADAQYKLVDGTVIANSKEDLLDGTLLNPIIKNASNVTVPNDASWDGYGYNNAYTATGPDGLLASDKGTCNDWTIADYNSSVALGGIRFTDNNWTTRKLDKCGYSRRLYCFEQASTSLSPAPSPTASSTPTPISIPNADLTIRNIRTVGAARVGRNVLINVDVRSSAKTKRESTAIESTSGITVEAVIKTPSGTSLGTCSKAVTSIPSSGTTVQITNCPNFTVKGKHTITATVDSTNVVSETDENNNQKSTSINVR